MSCHLIELLCLLILPFTQAHALQHHAIDIKTKTSNYLYMCELQFRRKFQRNGPPRAKVHEVTNVLFGCFCFEICIPKKCAMCVCLYVIIANLLVSFSLTENPSYMCTTHNQSHTKFGDGVIEIF